MSGFSAIDLSRLPAPEILKLVSFEDLLEEMTLYAIDEYPELERTIRLESEPFRKLLRVTAYHRMLDRLEFNDHARGLLLAHSWGAMLDHLGAFWELERLTIQEGDDTVFPPIPEIKESDDAFRLRIHLAPEAISSTGTEGSYKFFGLSASGKVKDVDVDSPERGDVVLTILSHDGDGTPSAELLETVRVAIYKDEIRRLNDLPPINPAVIVPYQVEAVLTLYDGPAEELVLETARTKLAAFIEEHHRLGHDITHAGIIEALYVPGAVQNVQILQPVGDIVVAAHQAAFSSAEPLISVGGRDV